MSTLQTKTAARPHTINPYGSPGAFRITTVVLKTTPNCESRMRGKTYTSGQRLFKLSGRGQQNVEWLENIVVLHLVKLLHVFFSLRRISKRRGYSLEGCLDLFLQIRSIFFLHCTPYTTVKDVHSINRPEGKSIVVDLTWKGNKLQYTVHCSPSMWWHSNTIVSTTIDQHSSKELEFGHQLTTIQNKYIIKTHLAFLPHSKIALHFHL